MQRATETHLAYRPELKSELSSKRSLEETAAVLQQELFEKQQVCKSVDEEVAKLREKLIAAEAEHEAVAVSAAERESALYSKVQALREEVDMCRTKVRKPRGDPGGAPGPRRVICLAVGVENNYGTQILGLAGPFWVAC